MKIEQEIMEMFDKEILYRNGDGTRHNCMSTSDEQELKSFISHIITLVQKREREEMVDLLLEPLEPCAVYNPDTGEYDIYSEVPRNLLGK